MQTKINFYGEHTILHITPLKYHDGNLCIKLNDIDGKPFGTLSSNVVKLDSNIFAAKTYSENKEFAPVILNEPCFVNMNHSVNSGFMDFPLYKFVKWPTYLEFSQEVLRLAEESPDAIYTVHPDFNGCSYTLGKCGKGNGCIFGQALQKWFKFTGTYSTELGHHPSHTSTIRLIINNAEYFSTVQFLQDCKESWGEINFKGMVEEVRKSDFANKFLNGEFTKMWKLKEEFINFYK